MKPLHPTYTEFWRSEEKRLLAAVQSAESGSVAQMVASAFYQAALANVRALTEQAQAHQWRSWPFYEMRAKHLGAKFDSRYSRA